MDINTDKLFKKPITVNIYEGGSSYNRKLKLLITVEWSSTTSGNLKRELLVRLTDENEPFFIYNLNLCEEDFLSLKSQQGLLVDFLAFPQKFIDLLELCGKEEFGDSPKFVLNLTTVGRLGADRGTAATLDVVETNPFKLLTHLSLKLLPATDDFIKKFLAANVKCLKEENGRLDSALRSTQNDLQGRLQSCQRELSGKNSEWELRQRELQSEICALSQRHQSQLKEEQERIMQIHRDAETRWSMEKQDLDLKLSRETRQSEARISLLEATNKDLQDRLQKMEGSLREVRSHLVSVQGEHQENLSKLTAVGREVQALTIQNQDYMRTSGNLKAQLAQVQQEARDKDNLLDRTKDLLNTTQQQKMHFENLCEQRQTIITKKETAVKTVSEELNKGNEIIRKLQTEIKNYHAKLKQRNQIACKQEELLSEREVRLSQVQADSTKFQEKLKDYQQQNEKLSAELADAKNKLEEYQKQIKSNENVISWLNKQLNGIQLGPSRGPVLYDPPTVPSARFPHQLAGMTTSTPLSHPAVVSPTAHPLYRPPVISANSNIMPKPMYSMQAVLNGANRSPAINLQSNVQGQTARSTLPVIDKNSVEPKGVSTPADLPKRPQSGETTKPKTRITRPVSSAPARTK